MRLHGVGLALLQRHLVHRRIHRLSAASISCHSSGPRSGISFHGLKTTVVFEFVFATEMCRLFR